MTRRELHVVIYTVLSMMIALTRMPRPMIVRPRALPLRCRATWPCPGGVLSLWRHLPPRCSTFLLRTHHLRG